MEQNFVYFLLISKGDLELVGNPKEVLSLLHKVPSHPVAREATLLTLLRSGEDWWVVQYIVGLESDFLTGYVFRFFHFYDVIVPKKKKTSTSLSFNSARFIRISLLSS